MSSYPVLLHWNFVQAMESFRAHLCMICPMELGKIKQSSPIGRPGASETLVDGMSLATLLNTSKYITYGFAQLVVPTWSRLRLRNERGIALPAV